MLNWIIDIATITIGALCVVAFVYGLIKPDREQLHRRFTRLDRRDHDRAERRREDLGSPIGSERRAAPRRTTDRM